MTFTAILPFNFGRPRKTRLAATLSEPERDALAMAMAQHVARTLAEAPSIAAVHLLAPVDPALPGTIWIADRSRGLNAELAAARAALAGAPTLFIHADLPLVTPAEIEALLSAAREHGAAIAPDAGTIGTNALALADGRAFTPAFGVASFERHRAALPDAAVIREPGLAHDVDDADSLALAMARGLTMPPQANPPAQGRIAPSI